MAFKFKKKRPCFAEGSRKNSKLPKKGKVWPSQKLLGCTIAGADAGRNQPKGLKCLTEF
jgi:hypothetical protein